MTNLLPVVELANGVPVTSSLEVATFFEKQHFNIVQSVKRLISELEQDFSQLNFQAANYFDEQNKPRVMYFLTRDGFTLLAMGFTGKKALQFKIAYIEAFNKMEEALKTQAVSLSTTDQRRPLDKLIKVWVNLGQISYRFAWTQVNSHFNLNSISELPTEWLPEAIAFVEEQIQAVQNLKLEESHALALEARKHRISESEKAELLESLKKERDQTCASRESELLKTSSNNLKKITNELYKEYSREVLPNTTISTDPIIYALHHQYHEAEELARKSTMELYHAYNTAISVVLAL